MRVCRRRYFRDMIIFILGPTGVGKTELSIPFAKRVGGEIISCDSMQVYKGMDIGTSKPSPLLREAVPHHLIDILEPDEDYSAAEFSRRARPAIDEIMGRGRLPIIVGGSGLYVRALVDGLFDDSPANWTLRLEIEKEAELYGKSYLHKRLELVDPQTASRLHPGDLRRVVRALEVYEKSRLPISFHHKVTKGIRDEFPMLFIGLCRERDELKKRIEERIEDMFRAGLVDEVRLLESRGPMGRMSSHALGYKETAGYLRGEYSLDTAKYLLKRNTKWFAKRQMTWFKKDKRIQWIKLTEGEDLEMVVDYMMELIDIGACHTCNG